MKILMLTITLLVVSYSSYADKWDDFYNQRLNVVHATIQASPAVGSWTAYANGQLCEGYIDGFIDGTTANNNYSEHRSQRYYDWRVKVLSLSDSALVQMKNMAIDGWKNAAYNTVLYFEHSCKYRTILLRETDAKRN